MITRILGRGKYSKIFVLYPIWGCALFCSMANDISQWLQNGADYHTGISLFERYCDNSFLLRQFKRGENSFNRSKLIELLSAVEFPEFQPDSEKSDNTENTTSTELPEVPEFRPVPEIPELFSIRKQIDRNYAELRGLHALMFGMPEGEELRELAEKVTRLGRANEELWQRLHYIRDNGVDPMAPEPPPPPVMVDLHLIERKEAIRKSLVKAKATARGQNPPKAKTLALIDQRTRELADINLLIENIRKGASHVS